MNFTHKNSRNRLFLLYNLKNVPPKQAADNWFIRGATKRAPQVILGSTVVLVPSRFFKIRITQIRLLTHVS